MKNLILAAFSLLAFMPIVSAHQIESSSTMLVETNKNQWILEIRGALTAFQREVWTAYNDTAYKSPEEFNELVIGLLYEKLNISINNKKIVLSDPRIKLGHETVVRFNVAEMPTNIENLVVTNTFFENINKSKSALIIVKEGFNKQQFLLTDSTNYTINLKAEGNKFTIVEQIVKPVKKSYLFIVLSFLIITILGLVYFYRNNNSSVQQNTEN